MRRKRFVLAHGCRGLSLQLLGPITPDLSGGGNPLGQWLSGKQEAEEQTGREGLYCPLLVHTYNNLTSSYSPPPKSPTPSP